MRSMGHDDDSTIANALSSVDPEWIGSRYRVRELLGHGGTAAAYCVLDTTSNQLVALKLLTLAPDDPARVRTIDLFEREYHTLTQLAHPRVVQTFDYGVDGGRPYYTMELLDGGDIRELAPLPWQDVCSVAYELCSALSLLHSRRLIHRDLTPRNIRRTTDGKSKLIDFGLLSPMGPTGLLAGTPPYVAPELLQSMTLDGRSDLFSLGATLYFALTGRVAFPARRFEQLRDIWRTSPIPPSQLNREIPQALDDLIMSLLRIDVGSRPKSAGEVMHRLAPLLDHPPAEQLSAARAHLATPKLVGRQDDIAAIRKQVIRAMRGRRGTLMLTGAAGVGRTRMIDAFILEAKLMGATAVRVGAADAASGPYGTAAAIANQLHAAGPAVAERAARAHPHVFEVLFQPGAGGAPSRLVDLLRAQADRSQLQEALQLWILELARERPLALAVDDIERIDEPSAALLASLVLGDDQPRLALVVSHETGSKAIAEDAVEIVREHSQIRQLFPLQPDEVKRLLSSVFGDVPNIDVLSHRVNALSRGLPRECMNLAQHLVDQDAITYAGGAWTLPAGFAPGLLPASMEEALARQLAKLSPTARQIAMLLSLAGTERLGRAELRSGCGTDSRHIDAAINELSLAQVIAGTPAGYALSHASISTLMRKSATDDEVRDCHGRLAGVAESSDEHPMVVVFHELQSTDPEAGLDRLLDHAQDAEARTSMCLHGAAALGDKAIARTMQLALQVAERTKRHKRDLQFVWVMHAGLAALGLGAHLFYDVPDAWLEQLKHDSGFDDWHALDASMAPDARALGAVGAAMQRYNAAPEEERVLAPPDAIKQLVAYVAIAVAVGGRAMDASLRARLPGLLEPFAPLNPIVRAMHNNVLAAKLVGECRLEQALSKAVEAYEQFQHVSDAELKIVSQVSAAVRQMITGTECIMGIHSEWIEDLGKKDVEPNQQAGVFYILQADALHQGDWEAAERYRREAERCGIQNRARPMFSSLQWTLHVHAMAKDLTGMRQVVADAREQADEQAGWVPVWHVAEAYYALIGGDLDGALKSAALARKTDSPCDGLSPWAAAARCCELEVLVQQERHDAALRLGLSLLEDCKHVGATHTARIAGCTVALAEAAVGDTTSAFRRLEAIIEEQRRLRVSGLLLGRSYEYAARAAIAALDEPALAKYSTLAAEQYRVGENSVLGALYERLMEDARRAGMGSVFSTDIAVRADTLQTSYTRVSTALAGCDSAGERAQRALGLLCDGERPARGHLFLVTDDGLALVASNTACGELDALTAYVSDYISVESEESVYTMTATEEATALATSCASGLWKEPSGVEYLATLLKAEHDGEPCIAGVAMLTTDAEQDRATVVQMAAALAKNLLESGDSVGVFAA